METNEMKKCPYCAEMIRSEAIKCKYCGSMLNRRTITFDGLSTPGYWHRVNEGKKVAGVCTGIAHQLDSPILILPLRLFFILMTIFYGIGFLLYIALWILMPSPNDRTGAGPGFGGGGYYGSSSAAKKQPAPPASETPATPQPKPEEPQAPTESAPPADTPAEEPTSDGQDWSTTPRTRIRPGLAALILAGVALIMLFAYRMALGVMFGGSLLPSSAAILTFLAATGVMTYIWYRGHRQLHTVETY